MRPARSTPARLWFVLILAFSLGGRASSEVEIARTPPLELAGMRSSVEVGLDLDLLEDADGSLSIDDVRGPAVASRFQRSSSSKPSFGLTSAVWWDPLGR